MSGSISAPSNGSTSTPLYPAISATFHLDSQGRYFASASLHDAESGREIRPRVLVGTTTTAGYQTSPGEWSFTLEDVCINQPGTYVVIVTAMRIRDEGAEYQAQVTSDVITVTA